MSRKAPSAESLKVLYARSGNECGYPDCEHPIFNDDGLYIAQLCHINAANEGGPRYVEKQSDHERSSHNNLLFLCYRHHKETDNEDKFPEFELITIKKQHESKFTELGKLATKNMLLQISLESKSYWKKQSNKTYQFDDLKIERDFDQGIFELFDELYKHVDTIRDYCDLCAETDSTSNMRAELKELFVKAELDFSSLDKVAGENPFYSRNSEMHNLGRRNFFAHILLCIGQLRIRTMDELLKKSPNDIELKTLAERFRLDFEIVYDNSYYTD